MYSKCFDRNGKEQKVWIPTKEEERREQIARNLREFDARVVASLPVEDQAAERQRREETFSRTLSILLKREGL